MLVITGHVLPHDPIPETTASFGFSNVDDALILYKGIDSRRTWGVGIAPGDTWGTQ